MHDADVVAQTERRGALPEGASDVRVRHGRKGQRRVLRRGPLVAHRRLGDHEVADQHVLLHPAGGADAYEGVRPARMELLDRDRRGRAADPRRRHGHPGALELAAPRQVLAVRRELPCPVEPRGE